MNKPLSRWRVERAGTFTGSYGRGWFATHPATQTGGWFSTWREAFDFAFEEAAR